MFRGAFLLAGTALADVPEGYQVVPGCNGCLMHESCIKSVENGKVIDDSFDVSCDKEMLVPNEQVYAMDSHTDGSVTFSQMNSSWVVPDLPKGGGLFSQSTNFFWPGFKAQQPEPRYPVLQPVLQYGQRPGQTDWELQSWFVWAFNNVALTGPRLNVKAGDHITSWMNFDESSQIWEVYGRNDANGQESILKVAKSKVGTNPFAYAMHVFETVMPATNYCDLYPPNNKIEFTGVSGNNGQAINWIPRTGKTDCQQTVVASDKGDDVKFSWVSNKDGVIV